MLKYLLELRRWLRRNPGNRDRQSDKRDRQCRRLKQERRDIRSWRGADFNKAAALAAVETALKRLGCDE